MEPRRPGVSAEDEPGGTTLLDLLRLLHARRRLFLLIVGGGLLLGLAFALLAPPSYRAEATLMPSVFLAEPDAASSLLQLRSASSSLGLALGHNMGNLSPLFPRLLSNRNLVGGLLSRHYPTAGGGDTDLLTVLKVKKTTPARDLERLTRSLRRVASASLDSRVGVTTIAVTLRDPETAAALANAVTEELNTFIRQLRTEQAGEKVRFISRRLAEVETQLAGAESTLTEFRMRNRQVIGSPLLMQEETRLTRDVTMNEQVYLTLKTQYELARIEQVKNLPDVLILERAARPFARFWPRRRQVMMLAAVLSVLAGLGAVLLSSYLQQIRRSGRAG